MIDNPFVWKGMSISFVSAIAKIVWEPDQKQICDLQLEVLIPKEDRRQVIAIYSFSIEDLEEEKKVGDFDKKIIWSSETPQMTYTDKIYRFMQKKES